jgi:hypothetical protein
MRRDWTLQFPRPPQPQQRASFRGAPLVERSGRYLNARRTRKPETVFETVVKRIHPRLGRQQNRPICRTFEVLYGTRTHGRLFTMNVRRGRPMRVCAQPRGFSHLACSRASPRFPWPCDLGATSPTAVVGSPARGLWRRRARDFTRVRGAPSAWVDTQVFHRDCPRGAGIEVEAPSPGCGAGPVRGVDEWQRV